MSLRRNILANYASQFYVTLIGIVMVPLLVKYMGVEAFGLVGFFAMSQAWFQLLDAGLTPTLARETARYNGGATDILSLRRLLRAMEGIFVGLAVLGAGAMVASAAPIARSWLHIQSLPLAEVQNAVRLMAIIIALRWVSGLYRGAINGFEKLIWLSGFNIIFATARFILVIPYFMLVGTTPTHFFAYQLLIAIVELLTVVLQTYRLLPRPPVNPVVPWRWAPLRRVLRFSLGIAFTSSAWLLVTQTDKLLLSKLLSLTNYAYFTLAVLAASGVTIVSGPVSAALTPRLTKLAAEHDEAGLVNLYRHASQLVAVIALPVALVMAFFAEQILWAWTGDSEVAKHAAPVLSLYALGNGVLALAAFPYYLQFAKGDLKLHIIGSALFALLLIPALIWATLKFSMLGAGYSWLGANIIYFLVWVPLVHRRFVAGLHRKWLLQDIGTVALAATAATAMAHVWLVLPIDRLQVAMYTVAVTFITMALSAAASSWVRTAISGAWGQFSHPQQTIRP